MCHLISWLQGWFFTGESPLEWFPEDICVWISGSDLLWPKCVGSSLMMKSSLPLTACLISVIQRRTGLRKHVLHKRRYYDPGLKHLCICTLCLNLPGSLPHCFQSVSVCTAIYPSPFIFVFKLTVGKWKHWCCLQLFNNVSMDWDYRYIFEDSNINVLDLFHVLKK